MPRLILKHLNHNIHPHYINALGEVLPTSSGTATMVRLHYIQCKDISGLNIIRENISFSQIEREIMNFHREFKQNP